MSEKSNTINDGVIEIGDSSIDDVMEITNDPDIDLVEEIIFVSSDNEDDTDEMDNNDLKEQLMSLTRDLREIEKREEEARTKYESLVNVLKAKIKCPVC